MGGETTALAVREGQQLAQNGNGGGALAGWTCEQKELVKAQIAKKTTDGELAMYEQVCRRLRLDPFRKEIYAYKRNNEDPLVIHIAIDGWRLIAERSGLYDGIIGPFWCGPDGQWTDVWLATTPPAAAKVAVLRRGWRDPVWAVRTLRSCNKPGPFWQGAPDEMLAKAAEALAIRRAFREESAVVDQVTSVVAFDPGTGEIVEHEPTPALAPASEEPARQSKPGAGRPPGSGDAATMRAANDQLAAAFRGASVDAKDVDLVSRIVLAGLNRPLDDARSLTAADRERLAKWTLANADAVSGIQVDLQREREAAAASAESPFEDGGAEEAAYEPEGGASDELKLSGQERAREAVRKAETQPTYGGLAGT